MYDINLAGKGDKQRWSLDECKNRFKFGTIKSGPVKLHFFGIKTFQDTDNTVSTDSDDKRNALTDPSLSLIRRKEYQVPINEIEKSFFESTKSSLGWILNSTSPLC